MIVGKKLDIVDIIIDINLVILIILLYEFILYNIIII